MAIGSTESRIKRFHFPIDNVDDRELHESKQDSAYELWETRHLFQDKTCAVASFTGVRRKRPARVCEITADRTKHEAYIADVKLVAKMTVWQVDEAAAHFEEIVEEVRAGGAHMITGHGAGDVVVISMQNFRSLTAPKPSEDPTSS